MNEYLKILVVDDEADSRETYKLLLENEGYAANVASSACEALEMLEREAHNIVISDIMMPEMDGVELLKRIKTAHGGSVEVIMLTGYGSIDTAVEVMKSGAFGYHIKSHSPDELLIEIKKAVDKLEIDNLKGLMKDTAADRFFTTSKNDEMRRLWELVEKVADSNANVMITGESGVGKEIVATVLHQKSKRVQKPFIAINCQQYPRQLIESELFGHEKGAYTGAAGRRIGRLEQAKGGTVFLDEIGDMAQDVQIKLLRVLENRTIERLGSNTQIAVDFRLVTATNKDLSRLISQELFRRDLFYRINTIEIHIPPLRERREDLEAFINYFVKKYSAETRKRIDRIDGRTMDFLMNYDYVGNVRELRNIIERMMILAGDDGILRLDENYPREFGNGKKSGSPVLTYAEAKKRFEEEYFSKVLAESGGNITHAADRANMSRRQFFNKITELKIKR